MARRGGYQEAPRIKNGFLSGDADDVAGARERLTELADALDLIPPSEIQFMEVYRGIGSIPGEFSGGCGAIVIWTQ